MCLKSFLLVVAIDILILGDLRGQHSPADSIFVERSRESAIALYNASINDRSLLYNGVEYKTFPEPYDGYPYFESEYVEEGDVLFDGDLYKKILLQYDLVTDVLILEHYDQKGYVAMMKPHQHMVKSFRLLNHTFIRVEGDSTGGMLKDGYYDVLHDGSIMALAKRKKSVSKDFEFSQLRITFPEKNFYYLVRNGAYYPIKGKASIIKVLQDRKKLLNQFAKKNQLDFGRDKEKSLVTLVTYYEQIQY